MNDQISFSSNRNAMQKFKVVLVGDQNVGKSSIIARYIRNEFDPTKNVSKFKFSQPSASILYLRTSQLLAKWYVCSCGILQDNKDSNPLSPAISKMLI